MAPTISTRFMIISDTHDYDFNNKRNANVPFQHPLPKVDVLLHSGDLTLQGDISSYRKLLNMLGSIEAELKLVIAGNHDRTLDRIHWTRFRQLRWGDDDGGQKATEDHEIAMEIMRGKLAQQAGVTYLEEGTHCFTLKNGAKFTIYVSPYQPEFCDWAFPYERTEDRYNPPDIVAEGVRSIEGCKVPDFPAIDIMMTHGPPKGILDSVPRRGTTEHVGCDALLTAVSRARPLLYCFGHIHEGHGAELVSWGEDKTTLGEGTIVKKDKIDVSFPGSVEPEIRFGEQTLMVNAAIMNVGYRPVNEPWIVDLDLPTELREN